jgi:hypothetical protein
VDLPASRIRLGLECVATVGARHRRTTAVQGCCCHRGGSSSVILFSQMNLWCLPSLTSVTGDGLGSGILACERKRAGARERDWGKVGF